MRGTPAGLEAEREKGVRGEQGEVGGVEREVRRGEGRGGGGGVVGGVWGGKGYFSRS